MDEKWIVNFCDVKNADCGGPATALQLRPFGLYLGKSIISRPQSVPEGTQSRSPKSVYATLGYIAVY